MPPFPTHFTQRFLVASLLSVAIVSVPSMVQATDIIQASAKTTHTRGDDVDARIQMLHKQLHITPDQQQAWDDVAAVMRANAKAMLEQNGLQAAEEKSATAPEMVTAYAKMMDVHADAVHKFIPVFEKLYASMSDGQKKTADVVFRERVHTAAAKQKPTAAKPKE